MSNLKGMNRRHFLRNSALGVGALSAGMLHPQEKKQEPEVENKEEWKIKEYRTLGRTGFKVSDISTGYVGNPAVLERMLDAGVNYIDTAESYGNEPIVGQVMKNRDRKKVFITTKMELKEDLSKEGFLKRARKCLERLQMDYVDCMMMHSAESVKLIKTEGFHEAMKQLKNEGKLRFVGISNHGSNHAQDGEDSMQKVLTAAAMDGRFDVMLLAYNFIQDDNGAEVLKLLREKNIGATLMKVNPIGNIPRIKNYIDKMKSDKKEVPEYLLQMLPRLEAKQKRAQGFITKYGLDDEKKMRDAAIKFCLSNPNVHTVCCSFRNFDSLDIFLPLSGTRLEDPEKKKLAAYKKGCSQLYCRHACGLCESSCPHDVRVNTIMRYNHYFAAQGKEKWAMKQYANLTVKADICQNCTGICESSCPYGVPVHGLLDMAHKTLSLA